MRSIWAGAISFGMVVIPVKLYAATEQRDVAFRQVHREDGGRIQFRRFCSADGEEVAYSDIAKGYELATGDVVVLTDDDLSELPLATAKRIDVLHFSPAGQLDPILSSKAYYLEPEPAGVRAYALFRDALDRSGRVAVAKVAIRQREALAALRVREGVLVLETLLWPDEVRAPEFKFLDEDVDVRGAELKMAASLIDTMTEDFDPSQYKDSYREALEALVQAKIEGNEVVRPPGAAAPAGEPSGPADLTETLRASVEAAKASRGKEEDAPPARSRQRKSPAVRKSSAERKQPEPKQPERKQPEHKEPERKQAERKPGRQPPQGQRVTAPLPHWPGRMTGLPGGEQVWVAATPGLFTDPDGTGQAAATARELVLCVHGMSGAATNWTDLMAELAPDFDCAALDLPGSGFSPPPRSAAGYSVSALAGTVIRLMEMLRDGGHPGPLHLIGNSMGGAVAVRAAARRPDLVRTLTLVSPALPDPRPRRTTAHFPVIGLPRLGELLIRRYVARFPAEDRVSGVYQACLADPGRVHPDRLALDVEALRRRDALGYDATALAAAARTLVSETLRPPPFSLWSAARRITAPSLILFGADDQLVPPRLAARAARTFAQARVEVLPDTGHIAQIEHPAVVAALFRELAGSTAPSGMPAADVQLTPADVTST